MGDSDDGVIEGDCTRGAVCLQEQPAPVSVELAKTAGALLSPSAVRNPALGAGEQGEAGQGQHLPCRRERGS